MEAMSVILVCAQLFFTLVVGMYFYNNLRQQKSARTAIVADSKAELEKIKKLRSIQLNRPLAEKTRPTAFDDIIGQEKGIRALRAALCGPNPQHVIIYGQPGIGKTAAARLVLENAKLSGKSPFGEQAPFVEMDATILQFDERSIADPLIGSVHDPIYQGAGAYGQAGIPQPKQGAVSNAHGGILFIDEIGELHQIQMNKLLKVLEDRKVNLSSSYYSKENTNIPQHIHDLFTNGIPADFRLVGATTRRPEDLPSALRSRCTEIFFKSLNPTEIAQISANACQKAGMDCEEGVPLLASKYCANGRDAVNLIQMAASLATLEERNTISIKDVEEILEYGRYTPTPVKQMPSEGRIGVANGLAVTGGGMGMILDIEVQAGPALHKGSGTIKVTGIIEEEEINSRNGKMRRASTAKNAIENMMTLLDKTSGVSPKDYDIHVNFPGGIPIDGPSAGVAIFTAVYSALTGQTIPPYLAMTGELSIKGRVCPVGGVSEKIEAAIEAGAKRVFIPRDNDQKRFAAYPVDIVCLDNIHQLLKEVFMVENKSVIPLDYSAVLQNSV